METNQKNTTAHQFIKVEFEWMKLIGTHKMDGKTIEINHAMVLFIALINNLSQNKTKHPTCYATNEYFANTLHVCESAISKYLQKLKKMDIIKTHEERPKGSRVTQVRYIYLQWGTINSMIGAQSLDTNVQESSETSITDTDAQESDELDPADVDVQKDTSITVSASITQTPTKTDDKKDKEAMLLAFENALGKGIITNSTFLNGIDGLAKTYSYDTIQRYVKWNEDIFDKAYNKIKDFPTEYSKANYILAILRNNLEKFASKQKESEEKKIVMTEEEAMHKAFQRSLGKSFVDNATWRTEINELAKTYSYDTLREFAEDKNDYLGDVHDDFWHRQVNDVDIQVQEILTIVKRDIEKFASKKAEVSSEPVPVNKYNPRPRRKGLEETDEEYEK